MATSTEYNMLFRLSAQLGHEFNSSFSNARRAISDTQKEIAELNKKQADISSYSKQQQAVENTTRKLNDLQREYDNIQREIQETEGYSSSLENKLIEKQRAIDNANRALQTQTERLERSRQALQDAGVDTEHLADESNQLTAQIEDLTEQQQRLTENAENFGSTGVQAFEAVGSALVSAGIEKGIQEIYQAYGDCVKIAGNFEETMSNVEALSGANASEMEQLNVLAKELGASTEFTAKESADAMTYMGMAGWDAQEMISGMNGVLQLASASGEDLAMTSDIVTDNLTAFGLTAADTARFSDVLAAAATESNTSVAIMGETFKSSASVAGALGYSIEDVSVAVGLMANAGVKGSIAGTALKNTFNGLLTGATITADAFGEIEVSSVKADGTMKSWSETVVELRGYFDQMTEAEKVNNAITIAGAYGYNGLLAIVNSTEEDFNKLTDSINNCTGAAAKMAEIKLDNLNGQITLMDSAMDALKITIGEAYQDELRALYKVATDVLTGINEFAEQHPIVLKGILAIVGAVSAVVAVYTAYSTIKKLVNTYKALSAILSARSAAATAAETTATVSATAAESAHAAAISATTIKMGLLVAAIAAVVAEAAFYYDAIAGVSEEVEAVQSATKQITDTMNDTIDSGKAEISMLESKVEVYNELRNTENRTAEQNAQLAALAQELQQTLGNEVEVVNSLTGEYNDLTASVDSYIQKQSQRVRMSALEEAAKQAYAQMDEIEREMGERSSKHHQYQTEFSMGRILDYNGAVETNSFINDMAAFREEMAKNQAIIDEYEEALKNETVASLEMSVASTAVEESNKDLNKALLAVQRGYLDVSSAARYYGINTSILQSSLDNVDSYAAQINSALEAIATGYLTAEEAAELYGVSVSEIDVTSQIQSTIDKLNELGTAYADVKSAAEDSIQGQYALWDTASVVIATSIGEINTALETQLSYWSDYNTDLTALIERADDIEGLRDVIATFADGSAESVNAIAGMADASDEDLQQMVSNWQQVQTQQEQASSSIAELVTGMSDEIGKMQTELEETVESLNLDEEAALAAEATVDAYVQAIRDGTDDAVDAAAQLSSLVAAALNPNSTFIPSTTDDVTISDESLISSVDLAALQKELQFVGPRLPAYASGTDGAEAGLALVGEYGPELVVFGGGEKVFTADETRGILNVHSPQLTAESDTAQSVIITISPHFAVNAAYDTDIEEILRSFNDELVENVMNALDEAGVDAKRGVYR